MTTTTGPHTIELHLGRAVRDALQAAGIGATTDDPQPDPILYHGAEPDDCCPDSDDLPPRIVVWWKGIGPAPGAAAGRGGCDTPPVMELGIRYLICWPTSDTGVPSDTELRETFAPKAQLLARAGWVGYMALSNELGLCDDAGRGRIAQRTAVSETLGWSTVTLGRALPRRPMGGCAGVDWTVTLTPTGTDVAGWLTPLDP